jgi:tetratricopeptide (TPR) repeat protein
MRIPARVTDGLLHFDDALRVAEEIEPTIGHKLVAEAHKERGFYYRNIGDWVAADQAYMKAQEALLRAVGEASSDTDLNEIASIDSNWAYVKALAGSHTDAILLAEHAVDLRRQYGSPIEVGISQSVCGEVYRYARRFDKAWAAYAAAESLLHERPNWNWLGIIYQEQAICLYQAFQDDVFLTQDPLTEARRLATTALGICLSNSIRGYPSALNRAGRIFGHDDQDKGLELLEEGIKQARRLSDGWFLLANLVEHAELSYRAWYATGDRRYLEQITKQAPIIQQTLGPDEPSYYFPDLVGRWEILQGHLALERYLSDPSNSDAPNDALQHYIVGFPAIAERSYASSGIALIPSEFENFQRLFRKLSPEQQADWQTRLVAAWQESNDGSPILLTRLQELLARPRGES